MTISTVERTIPLLRRERNTPSAWLAMRMRKDISKSCGAVTSTNGVETDAGSMRLLSNGQWAGYPPSTVVIEEEDVTERQDQENDEESLTDDEGLSETTVVNTGVYFNDVEIHQPVHPLQRVCVSGTIKLQKALDIPLGRPLRRPPVIAKFGQISRAKSKPVHKVILKGHLQNLPVKSMVLSSKIQPTEDRDAGINALRTIKQHLTPDQQLFLEASAALSQASVLSVSSSVCQTLPGAVYRKRSHSVSTLPAALNLDINAISRARSFSLSSSPSALTTSVTVSKSRSSAASLPPHFLTLAFPKRENVEGLLPPPFILPKFAATNASAAHHT